MLTYRIACKRYGCNDGEGKSRYCRLKIAGTRGKKLIMIGYANTTQMPAENYVN